MEHPTLDEKVSRSAPLTLEQRQKLIAFVQANEDLQSGLFSTRFTKKMARDMWQEITNEINCVPGGSRKDWEQVRRCWQDLKKTVKSKIVLQKRYAAGTGGGAPSQKILTPEEEIVLKIMPGTTIEGDMAIKLSNSHDFSFDANNEEVEEAQPVPPASTPEPRPFPSMDTTIEEIIMEVQTPPCRKRKAATTEAGPCFQYEEIPDKPPQSKTKMKRLDSSLAVSQEMLEFTKQSHRENADLASQKMAIKREYYQQKLTILKAAEARKAAQGEKMLAMQMQHNVLLQNICKKLEFKK